MRTQWEEEVDLIVVGSGAAGLVAAITAADAGMKTLVLEKLPVWGGTSAYSGGGLWIPANDLMARDGVDDSPEQALRYMNTVIDYTGPASSPERRLAYVQSARQMAAFLASKGFGWLRAGRYPDYYPEADGGMVGRALEGAVFNGKALGPWLKTIAGQPGVPNLAMTTRDAEAMPQALRTWRGFLGTSAMVARSLWWYATGRVPLGIGRALTGQLLHIALKHGVSLRLSSPMHGLVVEEDRVVGVVVEANGERRRIGARHGVVLTAGGFAKNTTMRRAHQPVDGHWSSASPGDTGDAISAGVAAGAATELMDEAWWGASIAAPDGGVWFSVYERAMPGAILVDGGGRRFVNESASYIDVGHAMLALAPNNAPAPTWLVFDATHRNRYLFGMAPPGITPKSWLDTGFLKRASTLEALAQQCGVDAAGLSASIKRFNAFARAGKDLDFARGDSAYDRYYSDPRVRPNPSLGPIDTAPFYAVRMVPGDLGTKGGLSTDQDGRVLRPDLTPIAGLYAAGNTTASVMGRTYPGPGSTLGPATTFAYRAARRAIQSARETSS
jgi:3-oxosteroid 1-dehydrogenase